MFPPGIRRVLYSFSSVTITRLMKVTLGNVRFSDLLLKFVITELKREFGRRRTVITTYNAIFMVAINLLGKLVDIIINAGQLPLQAKRCNDINYHKNSQRYPRERGAPKRRPRFDGP